MSFYLGQLIWLKLQKSCDLGAQLSTLNKQQISLNLDLELAKKNLKTARDEVAAMGGNQSSTVHLATSTFPCVFLVTLNRVTSLEQMCVVKTVNSKLV